MSSSLFKARAIVMGGQLYSNSQDGVRRLWGGTDQPHARRPDAGPVDIKGGVVDPAPYFPAHCTGQ